MTKAETTVERVGAYRVVRKLASGATSDVLLAKAEGPLGSERTVVLKLLAQFRDVAQFRDLSQFRNDEDLVRVFAREASAYSRLSHPTIVRLFDFFALPEVSADGGTQDRAGQLCMVLEHVDGPPLTRLRTMLKAAGQELDERASIHVATNIFDALAVAHAALDASGSPAPVVHRDVNPSNVLTSWDGHVKLADFGIARVSGLSHQSAVGMVKGTYGYMAPEQVMGDALTARSDVYAAGIILWELLAKRRAFQRGALPEVEALRAMAEPRLPSLDAIRPDLDPTIRDAVKRALEPRVDRRRITAEEMVSILGGIVAADEGRRHLVAALSVVRASAEPQALGGPGARTSTRPEGQTVSSTISPPATLPGVAPPPGESASTVEVAAAEPGALRLGSVSVPGDSLDEVRRPAPPTPRRSLVDSGPLKGTTASARLAIAVPDPPAPARPPAPSRPRADEGIDLTRTAGMAPTTAPGIGELPPAPPPMLAGVVGESDVGSRSAPQAFATVERTAPRTETMPTAAPRMDTTQPLTQTLPMAPLPGTPKRTESRTPSSPPLSLPSHPPVGSSPRYASSPPRFDVSSEPPRPFPTGAPVPPKAGMGAGAVAAVVCAIVGAVVVAVVLAGRAQPGTTDGTVATATATEMATPTPTATTTATTTTTTTATASATATATATPTATATTTATATATATTTATTPTTTPASAEIVPEGMGLLRTTGSVPGRRIFVDEKTLGQTPATVTVKCGRHSVRLGSSGKPQVIDVPCGGDISVTDKL